MTDTMTDTMTIEKPALEEAKLATIEQLRALYVDSDRASELKQDIERLLRNTRLRRDPARAHEPGNRPEARCLLVTGDSGSGKSRTVAEILSKEVGLSGFGIPRSGCPVVRVTAPSPCTLNNLGRAISAAVGYTYRTPTRESSVWAELPGRIERARVTCIVIDELQHLTATANRAELVKVRDTLKSLMIDERWPVALVLLGLPTVEDVIAEDTQVWRRKRVIRFEKLRQPDDDAIVADVVAALAVAAKLPLAPDASRALVPALVSAAGWAFGTAIEITLDAIEEALFADSPVLTLDHFADVYESRSGCSLEDNPFVGADGSDGLAIDEPPSDDDDEPRRTKGRSRW